MDNWITRIAAAHCTAGSTGLFWMFGVFIAVPWREGRMLALTKTELQVVGIPLVIGFAVAWGALHIFAISDRRRDRRQGMDRRENCLSAGNNNHKQETP